VKLHLIAGARPNFMKIAPLWHAMRGHPSIEGIFVHLAQHRDDAMSSLIWRELGLPEPNHILDWHGADVSNRQDRVRQSYEDLCRTDQPDAVLVVGDVTASLLAAQGASALGIALIHLEAGLRCFDQSVPEEINRIAIDGMADLLLTPSADADENLLSEGVAPSRIKRVGNIMIDTLEMNRGRISQEGTARKLGLSAECFVLVTLHRQSNVDDPEMLRAICSALIKIANRTTVCFVVHPRTEKRLLALDLLKDLRAAGIRLLSPMGYIAFASLTQDAALVITDSGGVQEETSFIGIPCLTLRSSTERPVTVDEGTNRLVDVNGLADAASDAVRDTGKHIPTSRHPARISMWDGETRFRVVQAIETFFAP